MLTLFVGAALLQRTQHGAGAISTLQRYAPPRGAAVRYRTDEVCPAGLWRAWRRGLCARPGLAGTDLIQDLKLLL